MKRAQYFCPNCDATLNKQKGFNPNKRAWVCTECGMMLSDENLYNGEQYEGVIWLCDNCGALLSKQRGFDDRCGIWNCKKCGYANPIDESQIFESEEAFYNSRNQNETNASFGSNDCFNSESDCSNDSNSATNDEDSGSSIYTCPVCGSDLNEQVGFFDSTEEWTCEDCGANLYHENFYDSFEVVYVADETDHRTKNTASNSGLYDLLYRLSQNTDNTWTTKKIKRIAKKVVAYTLLVVILCYFGYHIYAVSKKTPVSYDYGALVGQSHEYVVTKLVESGFNNITTIPLNDLLVEESGLIGIVDSVSIDGNLLFAKDDEYPYDVDIFVYYHSIKIASPPISAREARGNNCDEIANQLEQAGFTNITKIPIYDITLGWFTDDGEIEEISINGDTKFKTDAEYRIDAEIIIKYHTYKDNENG